MIIKNINTLFIILSVLCVTRISGMEPYPKSNYEAIIMHVHKNQKIYNEQDLDKESREDIEKGIQMRLEYYEDEGVLALVEPFFLRIPGPEKIKYDVIRDITIYCTHINDVFKIFLKLPQHERNEVLFIDDYLEFFQEFKGDETAPRRRKTIAKIKKKYEIVDPAQLKKERLTTEYHEIVKYAKLQYDKDYILDHMSINLMWCNREICSDNLLIFPTIWNRQGKDIDMMGRIIGWAKNYKWVTVWFLSEKVTQDQVEATQKEFEANKKRLGFSHNPQITLKDVRDLEAVKRHSKACDGSNFYFDLDLDRVAASYETLVSSAIGTFFLYADFSLDPEERDPDRLLDPASVYNLNKFAMIQGKTNRYENSFHIWSNHNEHLMVAIKYVLLDLNIARDKRNLYDSSLSQLVYGSYPLMFSLYCDLCQWSTAQLCGMGKFAQYDQKSWRDIPKCELADYLLMTYPNNLPRIGHTPFQVIEDQELKCMLVATGNYGLPVHPIQVPASHFG